MGRLKQPDRFDRAVERIWLGDGHKRALWEKQCTRLLRAEHNSIIRLVKREAASLNPTLSKEDWGKGYMQACMDILVALARRAK